MNKLMAVIGALVVVIIALLANGQSTGNAVKNFAPAAAEQDGVFKFSFLAPQDKALEGVYLSLEASGFSDIVSELNAQFKIPVNIAIKFTQCGDANAFYNSQEKTVYICYEFVKNAERVHSFTDQPNATRAAFSNTEFVLYHEIGHALIDILNIPITGREEDAADQLAFLMALSKGDGAAISTAYAFGVYAENQKTSDLQFWDEHSLDGQRFYNIVCWLYGQNPDKFQAVVANLLPNQRASNCGFEYNRMLNSWSRLLEPYLWEAP